MPKTSKDLSSHTETTDGFEGRYDELEGGYTVGFETYTKDADMAPMFKGLPGDSCQTPHWGYVVKGKLGFRYGDEEELIEAGEAYYAPPGHTPLFYAGSEIVEFSPTDELARTAETVTENIESADETE